MRYRKIKRLVAAGILTMGTILAPLRPVEAVDAWGAAAQALGIFAAYKSSLAGMLALGNNVGAQMQCRIQDIEQNGQDPNDHDVQVVNQVMQQLVTQGDYVLKANSLPFMWTVNDSKDFNAACYPTNYISINRALVRGLNLEPDELAAVFAHEMTHGLEQHSAKNYAKAVAQSIGMSMVNMDTGSMDWGRLNGLVNYSIAKNVTLPTEYDADEGGFYLMTSAGFNPGGGAAAMARMGYYLTYETQNFLEYQDPDPKKQERESYSDHPETKLREDRLAQMMTDYSAGHVTVQNRKDIYIDGKKLLSVEWTGEGYDNTAENAYYVAGAIAKAFHDYDSIAGWNFRADGEGSLTCLDNSRVNAKLREFLTLRSAGERLQRLVRAAYAGEAASGARQQLRVAEKKRDQQRYNLREAILNADARTVKKMRENADAYSDFGLGDKAQFQMKRVFASRQVDNLAESQAISARAKAVSGDFAGAVQEANAAVATDGKNIYTYLNRADIYHMQGNLAKALADLQQAKAIDKDNVISYLLSGRIYDEMGNKEEAEKDFAEFYRLRPRAYREIPEEYLETIAPKEYKEIQKEKAEARAKFAKEWKKEQKRKNKQ
ncbi:Zn-dependent protease with chaperone function [Selenomonas ruminantium]|uniref:Zn-dependent protease with chaperone function n=2 Tax=Selenomonas ruminantium TaxID=971 RepID=A0A1M6V3C6_SELRU|nr:M48 family metallopeptidase [Selenomonas ruminantium]SHK75871.1 Zn-dependent protease with chaperone function [Selenomonas ruminantium]